MASRQPSSLVRKLILLVEDDAETASVFLRILELYGFDVKVSGTVSEALKSLDQKPDGVVLDLMLPDGNGRTVLEAIRARHLTPRVAVTTGVSDEGQLSPVRALSPDLLLQKPIDIDMVIALFQNMPGRSPGA